MDIYSFIESKAVRKHLQDMNYQFTGKQMVVIILNSPMALRDKIDALRWVSSNMVIESDDEDRFCGDFYENFVAEVEQLAKLTDLIKSDGDGCFRVNGAEDEFYLGSFKEFQTYVKSFPVIERYGIQAEKRFFGEDKSNLFIEFSLNADGEVSKIIKYCIKQDLFGLVVLPVSGDDCKKTLKNVPLPFKPKEIIVPVKSMWTITYDCDIGTLIEKDGELKLCLITESGYVYDDGYDPYMFYCDYYNSDEPSDWINNVRNDSFPQEYVNLRSSSSRNEVGWTDEYNSKISIIKNVVSEL